MQSAALSFSAYSLRRVETPIDRKQGVRNYVAVVEVSDLPDLSDWRRINVRDPKLTGSLPKEIRESLLARPEFVFLNRGIVLAAGAVSFDQDSSQVTLKMTDPNLHGLLDGGHTYEIIKQNREQLAEKGEQRYVKVEIIEGFDAEELVNLVDARNSSNQVKDESLMNLAGEFEKIKTEVAKESYANKIAYKEFEVQEDGTPKPIDIREIISLLMTMDRKNFSASIHPINSYRSKAACLAHFKKNPAAFDPIYPLTADLLKLWDTIHIKLPELYNTGRAESGGVSGGRFGKLTGVVNLKNPMKLDYTGMESKYVIPTGLKYPILGAFRALLKKEGKRYQWGTDPFEIFDDGLGKSLANTIGEFALDAKNPSKTGKSQIVWQSCYQSAELAFLRLRK